MISTQINGQVCDVVPVSDRGLQYGDGLFETIAIMNERPVHWLRHMTRLRDGCVRLAIQPIESTLLATEADAMITGVDRGVLKLIVTRGSGGRGYRVTEKAVSTRIMQLHSWPDYPASCALQGVKVRLCKTRLGGNTALAGIKHLNRLEQVLARQEWSDENIREGLLMDGDDNLVEGTMSNVFIISDGLLLTPDLSRAGVAGVVRSIVLELAVQLGLDTRITQIDKAMLLRADEVFLTNSLIGIWPVTAVDASNYHVGNYTQQLQKLLAVASENDSAWREQPIHS